MSRMIPLMVIGLLVTIATPATATPVHQWSKQFGSTNPDAGYSVGTDISGNVFITGFVSQWVDFGGGPLFGPELANMFLARFDGSGAHLWSKLFPAVSDDLVVDAAGNVVVVGFCGGPVDFGGGPLLPLSPDDVFVVKFDANGVHQWSRRFRGGNISTSIYDVAIDASANVVITGSYGGSIDLGGGPLLSAGGNDAFVAKYDANGVHQWSKSYSSTGEVIGWGIAVDGAGNIAVAGYYTGTANLGGGSLPGAGAGDAFLAMYDPAGTHLWSKRFGSTGADAGWSVGFDGAGNVVTAGYFSLSVDFGGGALTSAGGRDIYLARYASNGAHQMSFRAGGTGTDHCHSIDIDTAGHVAMVGYFTGTTNLGGGPIASLGSLDVFLAEYDVNGNHMWSLGVGGAERDEGSGIAWDPAGDIVAIGSFQRTVDFGGGPFTAVAWDDVFVVKYGDQQPVPVLFTRFDATARGGAAHVEWDLWSDEGLETFALYRRAANEARAVLVATGDARATRTHTDTTVDPGATYTYELEIRTVEGNTFRSPAATVTVPTVATSIGPNYPNPFNPETTIEYTLSERAPVAIEIIDVSGAVVARLEQGTRSAGTHRVVWDGRDSEGRLAGSGVYFYRLSGITGVPTGKMVLLK